MIGFYKNKRTSYGSNICQLQIMRSNNWNYIHEIIDPSSVLKIRKKIRRWWILWNDFKSRHGEIFQCARNMARYTKCNNTSSWILKKIQLYLYYDTWCTRPYSQHTKKFLQDMINNEYTCPPLDPSLSFSFKWESFMSILNSHEKLVEIIGDFMYVIGKIKKSWIDGYYNDFKSSHDQ